MTIKWNPELLDELLGLLHVSSASDEEFTGKLKLSPRDRDILLAAGLLNYTRQKAQKP